MEVPILMCTFLIVSMQLGFAMLEVGCVRQEHRMTVLAKNILDSMISSLSFAIACDVLKPSIVLSAAGRTENYLIFLHWAFLSTSVTICSGSMAERTHLVAYLCYAVVMSGFAYPILAESVWGHGDSVLGSNFRGSAAGHSYYDYAGGGVVHLAGGVAALVGNLMVGRRILRPPVKDFLPKTTESAESSNPGPEEKNRMGDKELLTETWHRRFDNPEDDEKEFRANSYLQIMGIFNLWVGCYGFNACPAFLRNDRSSFADASLAAWNTTLAASAGALGAFLHQHLFQERMDIGFICNGVLSGLVASTACCDVLFTILATVIGFLAGFVVYPAGSYLLRRLLVDDPADAIAVHGGGGLFSVTVAAFSHPDCITHAAHALCHSGHHWGWQLLAQLRGAAVIIAWTTAVVMPVWALFLLSETIRSLELEELVALYERLCDSELGVASKQEPALQSAAQRSWVVRRLLRHSSLDLHDLREDVLDAIHDTKTALEMESRVVRLFVGIAKVLRRCRLICDACRLRLRIPPFAELVGLGALSKEGNTVADASRGVLSSSAERSNEEAATPLRLQLERLNRQVQNQGILLQRLSRGRRHSGWRRSNLYSVAEATEPTAQEEANAQEEGNESAGAVRLLADVAVTQQDPPAPPSPVPRPPVASATVPRIPAPGLPVASTRGREIQRSEEHGDLSLLHVRSTTPEDRPRNAAHLHPSASSHSVASASTVSDKSMGMLTPRSEGDETPPPTMYGRGISPSSPGSGRGGRHRSSEPDASTVAAVAAQLASLLQAQQCLSSTLQETGADLPRLRLAGPGSEPLSVRSRQSHSTRTSRSLSSVAVGLVRNVSGRSAESTSTDGTAVGM